MRLPNLRQTPGIPAFHRPTLCRSCRGCRLPSSLGTCAGRDRANILRVIRRAAQAASRAMRPGVGRAPAGLVAGVLWRLPARRVFSPCAAGVRGAEPARIAPQGPGAAWLPIAPSGRAAPALRGFVAIRHGDSSTGKLHRKTLQYPSRVHSPCVRHCRAEMPRVHSPCVHQRQAETGRMETSPP